MASNRTSWNAYSRRRRAEGLLLTTDTDLTPNPLNLGAKFVELLEIRARNFASAAKAAAGADVLVKIEITDNNGDVKYLDAADRDYATAEVTLAPVQDDLATGLGVTPVDATGTARAATEGATSPIVLESPVRIAILNGATTTDFMTVDLIVKG